MSVELLKNVFGQMVGFDALNIQLLEIKTSQRDGTTYLGRRITLSPNDKLTEFVGELAAKYTNDSKGILNTYTDLLDYDGTTNASTIYKLEASNELIVNEYHRLIEAIGTSDCELNPLELKPQAYVICGEVELDDEIQPVKLISMQCPITTLKHKFLCENGKFIEISDKVLSLKSSIDVVCIGTDVYFLSMAGEKLFNMERAYKSICHSKIKEVDESDIISNIEVFANTASSGHNPRRFVSFKESRLNRLKSRSCREEMARKFGIPLDGDKFDTTESKNAEKVVKLLCNKGMMDPFEDAPVEVTGSKNWN